MLIDRHHAAAPRQGAEETKMSIEIDVYWSFRSPYSWLATGRLRQMAAKYPVSFNMKFVRPLALREDGFFKKARPQFLPYLLNDMMREGERLGEPIAFPNPDPIVMDMATGDVATDQPYIHSLLDLGFAAELSEGRGLELAYAIAKPIWSGVPNWNEGDVLTEAASSAGFDLKALESWADDHRELIDKTLVDNEARQMTYHWGVPLMVLNDEPFFGQDRLESLEWRLQQLLQSQQ